jgi:hypothetical protein
VPSIAVEPRGDQKAVGGLGDLLDDLVDEGSLAFAPRAKGEGRYVLAADTGVASQHLECRRLARHLQVRVVEDRIAHLGLGLRVEM